MVEVQFMGTSMHPILEPGAVLTCCTDRAPRTGDIVVYAHGAELIAHRCVGRSPDGASWLVGGDNRLGLDPPVGREMCLGVVTGVRCRDRYLDCQMTTVRLAFRLLALAARLSARSDARTNPQAPTPPIPLWRRLLNHLAHGLLLLVASTRKCDAP